MAKLTISDPEGRTFEFSITKDEVRIGRNPGKNDLVLPSRQVSVTHAILRAMDGSYLLVDEQSTNGTYIYGERITQQWLGDGDVFTIADFTMRLSLELSDRNIAYHEMPLSERAVVRSTSVFVNILEALNEAQNEAKSEAKSEAQQPVSLVRKRDRRAELEAKLQEKVRTLEMLYAFGKTLSSVFDIDKIFTQIVELLFKLTPAERCAILLWNETSRSVEPYLVSFRPEADASLAQFTLNISRTITRKVLEERIAVISDDIQGDQRFNAAASIAAQSIHSVMCVPLIGKNQVLGVIYVDKLGINRPFDNDALDLLNAVAAQTAIAMDNAYAYDQLAQEAVMRASYQRFLPNQVIDLMLESPDMLQLGKGVTQPVTILFADIRNFTPLAEKGDPNTVIYILNRFFSAMTDIIFAYNGTLDKFLGDGLMALFGAPYQSINDPHNAVTAAIAMQRRMIALNQELQRYNLEPIEIGIGITCGEVTVGYIGSEMRMDYTAIGNAVNIAARLMSQAKGTQILISDSLRNAVGNSFMSREIAGLSLKGLANTPDIFEVIYS